MKVVVKIDFKGMDAYRFSYSLVGKPFADVYIYFVDQLLIDTSLVRMEKEALELVAGHRPQCVLLTHHHEDHSGNAAAIHQTFGIQIFGHELTVDKMATSFKILPYQKVIWGDAKPVEMQLLPETIETGSLTVKPIYTPGHSKDHTSYWVPERGWLFSGDLYLADRVKYFRADEIMRDEIESLKKVLTLDFDSLFCAHNPQISQGKKHIAAKLQFLEDLHGNVTDLAEKGYKPVQIMRKIHLKENTRVKWFCFGNVSAENMVKSSMYS